MPFLGGASLRTLPRPAPGKGTQKDSFTMFPKLQALAWPLLALSCLMVGAFLGEAQDQISDRAPNFPPIGVAVEIQVNAEPTPVPTSTATPTVFPAATNSD